MEVNVIFFASLEMWKEEGEMGTFFPLLKKIFVLFGWITGWMTQRTDGWKASFRPRRPLLYKNIRSPFLYLFLLSFCFAFLFFLFFCFSFISFFQIGFLNNNCEISFPKNEKDY